MMSEATLGSGMTLIVFRKFREPFAIGMSAIDPVGSLRVKTERFNPLAPESDGKTHPIAGSNAVPAVSAVFEPAYVAQGRAVPPVDPNL